MLGSTDPVSQRRVTLRGGEGMRLTVLASQQPVDDDYRHRLWLLTDLREVNWQSDFELSRKDGERGRPQCTVAADVGR